MIKKYDTSRIPSEYALLFSENEGAESRALFNFTPEKFEALKQNKYFTFRTGAIEDARIYPAYAVLVKCVEGYDFVLEQLNEIKEKNVKTLKGALENLNRRKAKNEKIKS